MSYLARRSALAARGVNLTVGEELTLYCEHGDLNGIIKTVEKHGLDSLYVDIVPRPTVTKWCGGAIFHLACRCGWAHIIEYLLGLGSISVNEDSVFFGTALHIVAENGYPKCLQVLLNCPGIDVNPTCYPRKRTPLMIAAQRGHAACVSIFLNHPDIQVNLQDEDGNTALHHSIECFPTDHWENPTNYSNDLERESYQSCLETLLRCEAVNIFILNHKRLDIHHLIRESSAKDGDNVRRVNSILLELAKHRLAKWNRTNVMLVGQGRAGKTAFTNNIIGRWFRETESTIGAEMIDLQLYSGSIKQGRWLRQGKLLADNKTEHEVEAAMKEKYFQQFKEAKEFNLSMKVSSTHVSPPSNSVDVGMKVSADRPRNPVPHCRTFRIPLNYPKLSVNGVSFSTVQSWTEQSELPPSFKLNLLDMGGQSIFNVLHPFFMSSYGVYLVVFDLELFMSKSESERLLCRKELEFWFNSIEMRCHEAVPIAIIGTRKDLIGDFSDHEKISQELEQLFRGSRLWPSVIKYSHKDSSKDLNFFPVNNKKWRVSTAVNQLLEKIDRALNDAEYLKEDVPIISMRIFDLMKATEKCALSYEEVSKIMKNEMKDKVPYFDLRGLNQHKQQGKQDPLGSASHLSPSFMMVDLYDEEKQKDMLRFLNSRGMALWIEEEGLQDVIILDPIEYFVRPATSIICKHIATEDDPYVTKHEIPEIHGKSKSALAEDWMRMIEYGMVSKRLVEDILNRFYDNEAKTAPSQQRRAIIDSSAADYEKRKEEMMKKIMLLMVKYGLMVPMMIDGEQSSFFIPSLLPANPSLLLLEDQKLHRRLMQRYELVSSPYTSSMTFSFFFYLPDTFEKLQIKKDSVFSSNEISEAGFLPYGLFERLVKPFVERIVEPLNLSESSDKSMLQLLKDNRLIIGFRDKIQFTYHHHKVRLINRLSESRIEVEVESHSTREDAEEERRKDSLLMAKIYGDLIQIIETVLRECYASLQIMTLIPLPVSLVKKPVSPLTSSKNNNANTPHETQGADCEVFLSLSQIRKLLSVREGSVEERESRDFISRDGHMISFKPMMMKKDSYWSIWRTNMINTTSPPPPLPLPTPRPLLPGKKTHIFLSHDWGIDDRNHRRVKYISEALKMRGFIPWIDDERLVNVVDGNIVDGMDYTEVLLVFLTENYQRKVNGRNSQDYCQREFLYGMCKLRKERTIVVVLDSSLTDTSRWTGLFRFNLTGVLYQNLSNVFREDGEEVTISEEEVNGKIDGLCEVIERVRSENTPRDDV